MLAVKGYIKELHSQVLLQKRQCFPNNVLILFRLLTGEIKHSQCSDAHLRKGEDQLKGPAHQSRIPFVVFVLKAGHCYLLALRAAGNNETHHELIHLHGSSKPHLILAMA